MLLLTGATGFLGGYLLRPLSDSGQTLRWLRPPGDRRTPVPTAHANGLAGDLTRPETLTVACDGVDTIVHLAAPWQPLPGQTPELVIAEGTRNLLAAARAAGVSRIVFVSAQGSGPGAPTRALRALAAAEEAVAAAPCEALVLRCGLVYGAGERLLERWLTHPVPRLGDPACLVEPLAVDDLARLVAGWVTRRDGPTGRFAIGGPETLTLAAWVGRASRLRAGSSRLLASLAGALTETVAAVGWRAVVRRGWAGPLAAELDRRLTVDQVAGAAQQVVWGTFERTRLEEGLRRWLVPEKKSQ